MTIVTQRPQAENILYSSALYTKNCYARKLFKTQEKFKPASLEINFPFKQTDIHGVSF